jgi:Tfp pilus assembly major pilin PilA
MDWRKKKKKEEEEEERLSSAWRLSCEHGSKGVKEDPVVENSSLVPCSTKHVNGDKKRTAMTMEERPSGDIDMIKG